MIDEQKLFEEYSVSRDIENEVDRIEAFATDNLQYRYAKRVKGFDGLRKRSGTVLVRIFGKLARLKYTVYKFNGDEKYYNRIAGQLEGKNYVNIEKNIIGLTFFFVNGYLDEVHTDENVFHEILHAYQWRVIKKKEPDRKYFSSELYQTNMGVIQDYQKNRNKKQMTRGTQIVTQLVYMSDRNEQDAFVHGYYGEMRTGKCNFAESNMKKRLTVYKNMLNDLEYLVSIKNADILNAIENVGLTPNVLKRIANDGYKRLKNKISHVDKLLGRQKSENVLVEHLYNEGILMEIVEEIVRKHFEQIQ